LFLEKSTETAVTRAALFDSNMHQIVVGWGFVPDPTGGAIQRSPDPQLYLGGLLLKSNLTVGATKSYVTVL